jgi:thymidylate synthase ThyX
LDKGIDNISVEIYPTIPYHHAVVTIASFYMSTWGDPISPVEWSNSDAQYYEARKHAQDAMDGKVLPNTLESIPLTFAINGVSRATTHQLVRTRVGAVFGQQGGRDNNWSDFNLRLPDTWHDFPELVHSAETLRIYQTNLYRKAINSGIPFQDARYVLPMGLETALVVSYNLLSFKSLVERRLCNRMMWETNYIVRKMTDLVVERYPFVGRNLRSGCEKRGVCGSVSPMFPPACYGRDGKLAKDNPTLAAQVEETGYDFEYKENGCSRHFAAWDRERMEVEAENNWVMSVSGPPRMLAEKEIVKGLWTWPI